MRPATVTAILLLATLVSADEKEKLHNDPHNDKLFDALSFGVYITKVGDFASTEYLIYRGGVEDNPFMQNRSTRVVATTLYPFAFNWATNEIRKDGHPKIALWMRIGFIAWHGYLIQHNLRLAARQ